MNGLVQLGRWTFVVLASTMGLMTGQFLLAQWKKGVSLGPKLFGAFGAGIYFASVLGVLLWKPWAYWLGLFVILMTLAVSVKGVFKAAHLAAAIFYTGLWLACLIWFLLPTVRIRFGV